MLLFQLPPEEYEKFLLHYKEVTHINKTTCSSLNHEAWIYEKISLGEGGERYITEKILLYTYTLCGNELFLRAYKNTINDILFSMRFSQQISISSMDYNGVPFLIYNGKKGYTKKGGMYYKNVRIYGKMWIDISSHSHWVSLDIYKFHRAYNALYEDILQIYKQDGGMRVWKMYSSMKKDKK